MAESYTQLKTMQGKSDELRDPGFMPVQFSAKPEKTQPIHDCANVSDLDFQTRFRVANRVCASRYVTKTKANITFFAEVWLLE